MLYPPLNVLFVSLMISLDVSVRAAPVGSKTAIKKKGGGYHPRSNIIIKPTFIQTIDSLQSSTNLPSLVSHPRGAPLSKGSTPAKARTEAKNLQYEARHRAKLGFFGRKRGESGIPSDFKFKRWEIKGQGTSSPQLIVREKFSETEKGRRFRRKLSLIKMMSDLKGIPREDLKVFDVDQLEVKWQEMQGGKEKNLPHTSSSLPSTEAMSDERGRSPASYQSQSPSSELDSQGHRPQRDLSGLWTEIFGENHDD